MRPFKRALFNLISTKSVIFLIWFCSETKQLTAQDKTKSAGILIGDIFPVQVERIDETEDGRFAQTNSIEYWSFNFDENLKSGELLIISQVSVPGQRYLNQHLYPLSTIKQTKDGLLVTAKQPMAADHRFITLKFKELPVIDSVSGTYSSKSVLSGRSIQKRFYNITDKDLVLYIDKPKN